MKFTMTKIAAGLVLAVAATGAQAAPVAWTGLFTMYNPLGAQIDANDALPGLAAATTGAIDFAGVGTNGATASNAGTFTLGSTDTFFGLNWSAANGILLGAGTYTHSTADTLPGVSGGSYTFTVGAGQLGGIIDFAWGGTTGIDVLMVWNVVGNTYTMTDPDLNGTPGTGMIDGPFPNFSANFNMAAVPEASTYGMMLAGLGLVGGMVSRRRKLMA